jgi:hypothetical protein
MGKSLALCDLALADVKAFSTPKLIIITNAGFDPLDPSSWTEPADYDLADRLSLAGELDNSISTVNAKRQFTFPETNKDMAAAVANIFTSRAIGIADIGTGALQSTTPARCILDSDFTDRPWAVGEIPRLAAGAYTVAES